MLPLMKLYTASLRNDERLIWTTSGWAKFRHFVYKSVDGPRYGEQKRIRSEMESKSLDYIMLQMIFS